MTAEDLREMSFQNVLDNVLKPAGVNVGGYPEELFLDLSDDEKDKWNCNICYLLVREARECTNKHLFCHTCVFAWSLTYGENSQKCPMCRADQRTYRPNKEVDKLLNDKRVKCPEDDCTFRSPLRIFLMHSHGRARYANDDVDLESLRPQRPTNMPGLIILPGGLALAGGLPGGAQRAAHIREQLQQGRAMIHQMMLLLHLEMQLRQQALVSYSQAQDSDTRLRRLDEVLALNEQLNEVGTILSALLSTPMASRNAAAGPNAHLQPTPPTGPRRVDVSRDVMMSRGSVLSSMSGTSGMSPGVLLGSRGVTVRSSVSGVTPPSLRNGDDDDDDDDDDITSESDATSVSSVVSVVTPRMRLSLTGQLHSPRGVGGVGTGANRRSDLSRPQRRTEIRSQLLSLSGTEEPASSLASPRLTRRESLTQNSVRNGNNQPTTRNSTSTNTVSVSLQRLDSNANRTDTLNSSSRDQSLSTSVSTSLPPLPRTPGVARHRSTSPGNRETGVSSQISPGGNVNSLAQPSPNSPRSLLPAGSSAHQRIMQSLSSDTNDDDDEEEDGAEGRNAIGGSNVAQRANSVSRRPSVSIDTNRRPHVMSEGVTASGATFMASADTPATRAASQQAETGTSRRAAVAAAAAAAADSVLSALSRGQASTSTSNTTLSSDLTSSTQQPTATTAQSSSVSSRQQLTSYAPQRRFRRENSNPGTGATTPTRRSSTQQVPYVPHRSGSPSRAARGAAGGPANSGRVIIRRGQSVEERRRASFSTQGSEEESVVRRAARGGARTSLPITPGQLLRARRGSQGRRSGGGGSGAGAGAGALDPNNTV